jgi:hypothetical protein
MRLAIVILIGVAACRSEDEPRADAWSDPALCPSWPPTNPCVYGRRCRYTGGGVGAGGPHPYSTCWTIEATAICTENNVWIVDEQQECRPKIFDTAPAQDVVDEADTSVADVSHAGGG